MPNIVDALGLRTKTLDEVRDAILNGGDGYPGYFIIYGPNINVGPNTPDGQQIAITAQATVDMLELLAQIFASFDPDQAIGTVLDARCAINGVIRRGATYTQQVVQVTVTQALTLPGLDTSPLSPFTVSDAAGNQFQLVTTYSFGGAGTQSLIFQASVLGPVETVIGTITQIVTTTLGVASVNNAAGAATLGIAEETDAQLRIRRANSVSLPSQGFIEGLLGALLDTDGVTQAIVYENVGSAPDVNGIPGHSIWCIVEGGTNADVADVIYRKRNAGCGMKGAVSVDIPQAPGILFPVKFDRPTPEDLWIKFDIAAITGTVDDDYVRAQILEFISYKIGQSADASEIVAFVKDLIPNGSISGEGVGLDGITYVSLQAPSAVANQFAIESAHIVINGTPGP